MDGKENGYLPAHPIPIAGCNDGGVYNALEQSGGTLGGLTKRELFAAMAMQGWISSGPKTLDGRNMTGSIEDGAIVSAAAVNYADALLEQLAKDHT